MGVTYPGMMVESSQFLPFVLKQIMTFVVKDPSLL